MAIKSDNEKCKEIKKYVEEHGIKQSWLAKKTGISYQRIRYLMNGFAVLHADEANLINAALGTNF